MKPAVKELLERVAIAQRSILKGLTHEDRIRLLEALFVDFFLEHWRTLVKWAALTGQSAQVDTGYIAQHVASIVLGEPGQGFRGKGDDLLDRTEVKSASAISGIDRPRWNHHLGTTADDTNRRAKGLPTVWEEYLAAPNAFYLLFDRVMDSSTAKRTLRVRGWCIDSQRDDAWRKLLLDFVRSRGTTNKKNLQLHPPVSYDDSIVVNELGNLDFAEVLVFEARIRGLDTTDGEFSIDWVQKPPPEVRPVSGRSKPLAYGGRGTRPSRLNAPADVLPDLAVLQELLPDVDLGPAMAVLRTQPPILAEEIEDDLSD